MAFAAVCWYYGIEIEFLPTKARFGFANSETELVHEKARVWLPTQPPCHTDFDIIEKGNVPMLFSLGQMCNLNFSFSVLSFLLSMRKLISSVLCASILHRR